MIACLLDVPAWVWLVQVLLYPVYQILGTLKHEGGHALGAAIEGRGIDRFVFWPQLDLGYFTWGYVRYRYAPVPLPRYVHLMPYYLDALWCAAGVWIIWQIGLGAMPPFWMATSVVLAFVVPGADVLWNIAKWTLEGTGDFAQAFPREEP